MLWSGDAGQQWSARKVEQLDAESDRSNAMEGMIEKRDVSFDADDEIVVETRSNGREVIRGLAIPYNRLSVDLGGFRERIMPGAFDKILSRQRGKGEIVSYFNHDPNWLLGRESAGTLEISVDDRGISYVVEPPDTQAGRDVLALVRSRNLRGSSFSFTVSQRGGERFTTDETGKAIREVVEAAGLFEMGPVVQPAYPSTSAAVAMRSYQAWLEEQRCGCEKIDGVAEQARKQQSQFAMNAAIRLTAARLKSYLRNCGTGSGGFTAGNTCGKGGGSGDAGSGDSGGSGGGTAGGAVSDGPSGGGTDGKPDQSKSSVKRKERYLDRIEGTQKEADREVKKANDKVAKLQKKVAEVKSQLAAGSQLEAAKQKVAAAESKLKSASAKKSELTQKLDSSKARIAELKARLDAMKKRSTADELDEELVKALDEADSLRRQIVDLNDVLDGIASDLN
jgi:HK97 family phage prohead protease